MVHIDEGGLLTAWEGNPKNACIPEGVTTIGKGAFRNNTVLRSAILPTSLKTIGDMAFEGCRSLEKVVLLPGVKRLGNGCFRGCVSLERIEMPETVVSIHANAFDNCSRLEEVILPGTLRRNLEPRTFAQCSSLKRVIIPEGIQQIRRSAFQDCVALKEVLIQNGNVLIDRTAFERCEELDEEMLTFIQSHVLNDNTVDINSRAAGPAGRLSNYTERHFTFDGMECRSIEGVLQSLKCPDLAVQREICLLTGGWAKKAGGQYEWRSNQMLYWQGKTYPRHSDEYGKLLDRLYDQVFEQDAAFRADLASLQGQKIDHRMGLTNPSETVLTRMEFVKALQRLIEKTL